ncbi:MAG: hypothetical protein AAF108_10910 [Planctomycetota bacterium]
MTRPTLAALLLPLLAASPLLTGCETQSAYVANDDQELVTLDINLADWENAAGAVTESMLEFGILQDMYEEKGEERVLVEINSYQNNTSKIIDKDVILRKVKNTLLRTRQVSATGNGSDAVGRTAEGDFLGEGADFFLTLKLIEQQASSGRTTERGYLIQMALFDGSGYEVWGEEKKVVKQQKRSTFGL